MLFWTEERTAIAVKLRNEGLSASLIAARIGGCTRNAVIGKLHRMGMNCNSSPAVRRYRNGHASALTRRRRKTERTVAERLNDFRMRAERQAMVQAAIERAEIQAGPDLLRPVDQMVKTVDLGPGMCKWPYGTGPYMHCGLGRVPGSSYCDFHHKRAFRPVQPERPTSTSPSRLHSNMSTKFVPTEFDKAVEPV